MYFNINLAWKTVGTLLGCTIFMPNSIHGVVLIDGISRNILIQHNVKRQVVSGINKICYIKILFYMLQNNHIQINTVIHNTNLVEQYITIEQLIEALIFLDDYQYVQIACLVIKNNIGGAIDATSYQNIVNEIFLAAGALNTHMIGDSIDTNVGDIGLLLSNIIHEYPQYLYLFKKYKTTINNTSVINPNLLINDQIFGLVTSDGGGVFFKFFTTHHTQKLFITAMHKHAKDALYHDVKKILTIGDAKYKTLTITKAHQPMASVQIWLGEEDSIGVCTLQDILVCVDKIQQDDLRVEIEYIGPITAPIDHHTKIATLIIKIADQEVGRYNLYTVKDVKKVTGFTKLYKLFWQIILT